MPLRQRELRHPGRLHARHTRVSLSRRTVSLVTQPCYSISGSVRSRSSAGGVSSDSGDGTADCAHLGFAPLDVDLRKLPKELDEKVAKLLFQVVGTELFWIFRIFWIFRARKVYKLPARLISSELRAHQMSLSGVPSHWRSRRALQLIRAECSSNGSCWSHPALAESSRTPASVHGELGVAGPAS